MRLLTIRIVTDISTNWIRLNQGEMKNRIKVRDSFDTEKHNFFSIQR